MDVFVVDVLRCGVCCFEGDGVCGVADVRVGVPKFVVFVVGGVEMESAGAVEGAW